jgi:hypothetical protein
LLNLKLKGSKILTIFEGNPNPVVFSASLSAPPTESTEFRIRVEHIRESSDVEDETDLMMLKGILSRPKSDASIFKTLTEDDTKGPVKGASRRPATTTSVSISDRAGILGRGPSNKSNRVFPTLRIAGDILRGNRHAPGLRVEPESHTFTRENYAEPVHFRFLFEKPGWSSVRLESVTSTGNYREIVSDRAICRTVPKSGSYLKEKKNGE